MKSILKIGILVSTLILNCLAFSENIELVERSAIGQSAQVDLQLARKEIQDQALQKVLEDIISDLIGSEKLQKNKTLIQKRIITQSAKFVPFSKNGDLSTQDGQTKMNCIFKVSITDLKTILKDLGLIQVNETTPLILPLISFQDKVKFREFRWWKSELNAENAFLLNQSRTFENSLRVSLGKNLIYSLKPTEGKDFQALKDLSWGDKISNDDLQILGQMYQVPLVIEGQIQYGYSAENSRQFKVEIKLQAVQLSNGKMIADVYRKFDTDIGIFESVVDKKVKEVVDSVSTDLSFQIFEVWQKGSLGAMSYKLTFKGKIPIQLKDKLKEQIKTNYPSVKSLTERLIDSESITFEMNSTDDLQKLSQQMHHLEFEQMKFDFVRVDGNEIIFRMIK